MAEATSCFVQMNFIIFKSGPFPSLEAWIPCSLNTMQVTLDAILLCKSLKDAFSQ